MGYRSRLGKVDKLHRLRFMDKNYDECVRILESMDYGDARDEGALYRPFFHEQLIELGKYCQFDIQPESFYNGFDIEEECESEFHILTKEGLKQIIREYHDNIAVNYKEMYEKFNSERERDRGEVESFLRTRMNEWDVERCNMYMQCERPFNMNPYYLDETSSDGFIAKSWQYEYQIFNLTYIYRTFDWVNDYLIYSAW